MKVMITGACGYVARSLIAQLETRGHELLLVDRTPPQEATMFNPGGASRLERPLKTEWPFIQAEINDEEAMLKATEGMDAVINLAAVVTGFPEQGVEIFRVNALGTFIVLDAARKAGVKRVLVASSINAYGTIYWRLSGKPSPYTTMPLDESFAPVPEDPYSLTKYLNEETCAAFHRAYGLTTAAFRFAGVWRDDMYREKLEQGLTPTTEWSDLLYQWVHVEDLVKGIAQCLDEPNLPGHGVYTLGAADTICPEPTQEIIERYRPDLAATMSKPLVGRAPLLSIDRARAAFGYDPQYRLGS